MLSYIAHLRSDPHAQTSRPSSRSSMVIFARYASVLTEYAILKFLAVLRKATDAEAGANRAGTGSVVGRGELIRSFSLVISSKEIVRRCFARWSKSGWWQAGGKCTLYQYETETLPQTDNELRPTLGPLRYRRPF